MAASTPALRQLFGKYFPRRWDFWRTSQNTNSEASPWNSRHMPTNTSRKGRQELLGDEVGLAPFPPEMHGGKGLRTDVSRVSDAPKSSGGLSPNSASGKSSIALESMSGIQHPSSHAEPSLRFDIQRTVEYQVSNQPRNAYIAGPASVSYRNDGRHYSIRAN